MINMAGHWMLNMCPSCELDELPSRTCSFSLFWPFDCLIDWLFDWLINWLFDWLIFVDWLLKIACVSVTNPVFVLSACRILTDYNDFSLVSLVCLALNLRPSFGSPDRAVVGRRAGATWRCVGGCGWLLASRGPTLPETNSSHLKIGHPKRKRSYSNHPVLGAKMLVSGFTEPEMEHHRLKTLASLPGKGYYVNSQEGYHTYKPN